MHLCTTVKSNDALLSIPKPVPGRLVHRVGECSGLPHTNFHPCRVVSFFVRAVCVFTNVSFETLYFPIKVS